MLALLAEHDIRMIKVRLKISGRFHTVHYNELNILPGLEVINQLRENITGIFFILLHLLLKKLRLFLP